MNNISDQTIKDIVVDDFRTAQVFKKYGLDFCCGGGRQLSEACEKKGVDMNRLLADIDRLSDRQSGENNFKEWSPSFLIDYIINTHHAFVRSKLPEIKDYAQKVAKVHGKTYPALDDMLGIFLMLKDEMLSHLEAEEQVLFPYIKKMVELQSGSGDDMMKTGSGGGLGFQTIEQMEAEHQQAGKLMEQLSALSNGFTPPEDACTTFRIYFQNLEAFQDDLHKHVHLENNILFPKALDLEKRINPSIPYEK